MYSIENDYYRYRLYVILIRYTHTSYNDVAYTTGSDELYYFATSGRDTSIQPNICAIKITCIIIISVASAVVDTAVYIYHRTSDIKKKKKNRCTRACRISSL